MKDLVETFGAAMFDTRMIQSPQRSEAVCDEEVGFGRVCFSFHDFCTCVVRSILVCVQARSARILIISLKYYEYHCITHSYHCTLSKIIIKHSNVTKYFNSRFALEHRYVRSSLIRNLLLQRTRSSCEIFPSPNFCRNARTAEPSNER